MKVLVLVAKSGVALVDKAVLAGDGLLAIVFLAG